MTLPTGEQFALETSTSSGEIRATITAVAAGIRSLSINGIDLVPSYAEDRTPPMGAGIVLAPWPNRIRDGRWSHDGTEYQLAITEPARSNAIHGLLRYTEYKPIVREGQRVGGIDLDDAFGEVASEDGQVLHSLTAPDGRSVSIWADDEFEYVQVFTTREFPGEDGDVAIAVEPMTAPAEAFNSGRGLKWLDPGEEWQVSWGIRFEGFAP